MGLGGTVPSTPCIIQPPRCSSTVGGPVPPIPWPSTQSRRGRRPPRTYKRCSMPRDRSTRRSTPRPTPVRSRCCSPPPTRIGSVPWYWATRQPGWSSTTTTRSGCSGDNVEAILDVSLRCSGDGRVGQARRSGPGPGRGARGAAGETVAFGPHSSGSRGNVANPVGGRRARRTLLIAGADADPACNGERHRSVLPWLNIFAEHIAGSQLLSAPRKGDRVHTSELPRDCRARRRVPHRNNLTGCDRSCAHDHPL